MVALPAIVFYIPSISLCLLLIVDAHSAREGEQQSGLLGVRTAPATILIDLVCKEGGYPATLCIDLKSRCVWVVRREKVDP
jgi:hypothetical protein